MMLAAGPVWTRRSGCSGRRYRMRPALADALLRGCPNLALLATSREPLGIDGERIYRVPSLGTPADGDDIGAIRASEAVRLLEDRAAEQGVPLGGDGSAAEAADALRALLDVPGAQRATLTRARALAAAATLAERAGSYAAAEDYCQE